MTVRLVSTRQRVTLTSSRTGTVLSSSRPQVTLTADRQGRQGDQGDAGQGVPTGGTSGQVLTKDSGTDYDTSWQDPTGGGGVPNGGTFGQLLYKQSGTDGDALWQDQRVSFITYLVAFDVSAFYSGATTRQDVADALALAPNPPSTNWWLQNQTDPTFDGIYIVDASNNGFPLVIDGDLLGQLTWVLYEFDETFTPQTRFETWIHWQTGTASNTWIALPSRSLNVSYEPAVVGDWDGSITTAEEALDELAARVRALE